MSDAQSFGAIAVGLFFCVYLGASLFDENRGWLWFPGKLICSAVLAGSLCAVLYCVYEFIALAWR